MMTIAIDMDNVIADVETQFITWYHKHYGLLISRKALEGVSEVDAFPDPAAARKFLYEPGFFRTLPVIPGSQDALRSMSEAFDIYIVSAAMEFPQSLHEKYLWLEEHFPFISWKKVIFCGDKSKIATDLMIDDHLKNLMHFSGRGIMFTASHNMHIDYPLRVNDWTQATNYLKALA